MGWADSREAAGIKQAGIALDLFPELSENERLVVKLLQKMNDLQLNIISVKTGIPIGQLSSLLFNLEMKGVVKPYAGGTYHLLG